MESVIFQVICLKLKLIKNPAEPPILVFSSNLSTILTEFSFSFEKSQLQFPLRPKQQSSKSSQFFGGESYSSIFMFFLGKSYSSISYFSACVALTNLQIITKFQFRFSFKNIICFKKQKSSNIRQARFFLLLTDILLQSFDRNLLIINSLLS